MSTMRKITENALIVFGTLIAVILIVSALTGCTASQRRSFVEGFTGTPPVVAEDGTVVEEGSDGVWAETLSALGGAAAVAAATYIRSLQKRAK